MVIVSIALAAGLWLVALARLRAPGQSLRKPAFDSQGPTDAHNLRCIVLTAAVATLYVRPVNGFVDSSLGVAGLAGTFMFILLILGSSELLMALRAITLPPDQARAGAWRRGGATALVIGGLVTALLLGQPARSDLSVRWPHPGWMLVFWMFWLGWCLAASGRAAVTAARCAHRVGPSRLHTSLIFLCAGAIGLGAYAIVRASVIWATVRSVAPHPLASWLVLLAVTVMAVSAAMASSWPMLGRRIDAARIRRRLRTLRPLWTHLSVVDPDIALNPFPGDSGQLSADQARFALYRACIEIRDWMRLLSARLPATAWDVACHVSAEGTDKEDAFRATAGWIAAGLAVGPKASEPGSPVPPVGEDVDQMETFLLGVAKVPPTTANTLAERITSTSWETVQ